MEFQDVVRKRRMVRNFADEPIPKEVVDRILENAIRAPSAGNTQGWSFLVLEGDDCKRFWTALFPKEGREKFRWQGLFNAPLIVVPLSSMDAYLDRYAEVDKGWSDRDRSRWPVPYWDIDTGFASLLMLLTVVDAGLGALFFGIHRQKQFREEFGVPETHTAIGAIAIGYPEPDEPSPSLQRKKRTVDEAVHRGNW